MKSVGLQYIEALAELTASGWNPKRTIHVSFVPDEEIGGLDGMGRLVKSRVFRSLNVGVALDEGLPNPKSQFNVYYGERQTWWLFLRVNGDPGHGATIPATTAPLLLHDIIGRALAFRQAQYNRLRSGVDIGDIIGVNVAFLKAGIPNEHTLGGYAINVIPSEAHAGFDIRVPPTVKKERMEAEIERWIMCGDSRCPGVSYEWVMKVDLPVTTSRDPEVNTFIRAFNNGMEKAGIVDRLRHGIFPAATDGRYIREQGIPCFGFSPIEKTPDLLHKHNEFINVEGYMKGYRIYKSIIRELADYDPDSDLLEDLSAEKSKAKQNATDLTIEQNNVTEDKHAVEDKIAMQDNNEEDSAPRKETSDIGIAAGDDFTAKEDL